MDQNHKRRYPSNNAELRTQSNSGLTQRQAYYATKYENHDFALIALVGVKGVLFPSSQNKEYMNTVNIRIRTVQSTVKFWLKKQLNHIKFRNNNCTIKFLLL